MHVCDLAKCIRGHQNEHGVLCSPIVRLQWLPCTGGACHVQLGLLFISHTLTKGLGMPQR